LTNLVTLSFWMQERSAVARHVAAVVSSPAVVDTAALQQQQQQQVEALTTERNEAVQQAQQLQETLDTVVVTHTADEEVWQAVQPLLEAQVRMQATRLQGLEEQIAQFTAEKHATEEQGRRLQADMDELWEQAQGLQQNRNDWEDLARRFEEETIPAREAELLQSRDFAKELQKRASEYAAEVERLRNTVFGLEEEKKVLLAKLA
jgi:chromosome segregation ATPase